MSAVLVTGAARGLGRALTEQFRDAGKTVFPLVRTLRDAEALAGENIFPIVGDVTEEAVIPAIRSAVSAGTGRLDIVIHNAGVYGTGRTLTEIDIPSVRRCLDVYCLGAIRVARATIDFLQKGRAPTLVNISSRMGSVTNQSRDLYKGFNASYGYRIGKAAQNMFTACLRNELAETGVRVLAIHPGRFRSALSTRSPLKDDTGIMSPEDAAARIVRFLLHPSSDPAAAPFIEPEVGPLPW